MKARIGWTLFFTCLIFAYVGAYATEQDHTCQGGHNCNGDSGPTPTSTPTGIPNIDNRSGGGTGGTGGTGGNSDVVINEVHPDDIKIKNTPSIGLATPQDAIGFTFAIPGFATGLNLPWTRKDKKLLPVYDRLMAEGTARSLKDARAVICSTSPMKLVYTSHELCTADGDVGGASSDTGKSQETTKPLLLAQVSERHFKEAQQERDKDIAKLEREINLRQKENEVLRALIMEQRAYLEKDADNVQHAIELVKRNLEDE